MQYRNPILVGMTLLLVVVFLIALGIGQVPVSINEIFQILTEKKGLASSFMPSAVSETVLWNIRLPRLLMTVVIGAALSVSGASLQGLFRNPLVESGLIGVSGGAALFVVTFIVFGHTFSGAYGITAMYLILPFFAFTGGLLATFLLLKISTLSAKTNITILILAGVAISALTGALIGLAIFYADENQLRTFTFWTLGSLGGASWEKLAFAAPLIICAVSGLLFYQNSLNAIALGEAEALHLGVDVERVKLHIIVLSALAVGVSVSLSGIIGFLGLVVPHLIRVTFGSDNRLVLPVALIGGPLLLIIADLIARTLVSPAELPIGVVTALVGAPFFIFLLLRAKSNGEMASV